MTLPERYRSRKLWVWMAMTALATWMRYDNMIEPDHWEHVTLFVTAVYLGAQAAQNGMLGKKYPYTDTSGRG